ncbi:MAG: Bax inhibitor-1/YccA family protein [Myxococcaceae bacterium]|nr:Bax inhibitor-1/YccA family protein [Myxococcaceae bacterium]MBH2006071.1 Bax inhibitor-1/YccA family protein [Myxococcaceae bacterium]
MESNNPVLARGLQKSGSDDLSHDRMSLEGTVNKTGFLLALAGAAAAYPWSLVHAQNANALGIPMWGGMIGGFILALAISFRPHWAPLAAPAYALCEGLLLGAISAMFNVQYPGIALQAMLGTFGVLGVMLLIYRTGMIAVNERFRIGMMAATGGIAFLYIASMILGFFGIQIPGIFGNGLVGIGFSVVVVCVAALNLVLDFDLIARGARQGAPKYMEWFGAFALMVTLVWLYLEMLRLISKLRSRD